MSKESDWMKEKIEEETEKETEEETKEETEKETNNSINRPNITNIINLVKNTIYNTLCNYFNSLSNSVLFVSILDPRELLNNSQESSNKNRYHFKGHKEKPNNNFKLHLFKKNKKINENEVDIILTDF
ncbi:8610_t:CDS:2 [Cetraspora pellucida]|uniref:8610_t:CDS:1 n=1 Tax=Cetraspora pellucida TaxID=1433469 RepID=A0A9N9F0C6_9GLOM|nr:8610_t:CDS:2 [Cetraspora pellucida]